MGGQAMKLKCAQPHKWQEDSFGAREGMRRHHFTRESPNANKIVFGLFLPTQMSARGGQKEMACAG
jgi:hypothetical protein